MLQWSAILIFAAFAPAFVAGQSLGSPDLGQLSKKQFQDRLSKALSQSLPAQPFVRLEQAPATCAIPLLEGKVSPSRPLPREIAPAGPGNIDHMPIIVGRACRNWFKR